MEKAQATLRQIKEMGPVEWITKDLEVRVFLLSGRVLTWRKIPRILNRPKAKPKAGSRKKISPSFELVSVDESNA